MIQLADLWLPILASAVFVFLASSVIHMLLPIHRSDMKKVKGEDEILETMRKLGVAPGDYMFPHAGSMKEMGTPEMVEKMRRGPVGTMIIRAPGGFSMGKSLGQWFALCVVISIIVAYVATMVLHPASYGPLIFRLTATAALLGHAFSHAPDSIWKGQSWMTTLKFAFDGLIYALVTGATFAWLWPRIG